MRSTPASAAPRSSRPRVDPGSISQRTFERFGFQVIYTRAIFVLS